MRNIATGLATYGRVSYGRGKVDLTDTQPFHGVVDISTTLIQVTLDLRTFNYEPDTRQKNAGG